MSSLANVLVVFLKGLWFIFSIHFLLFLERFCKAPKEYKRFFASGSFLNSHKDSDLHNKENKLYMRAGK